MIVIRDVFQLEFGKAREGIELLKRGQAALREAGYPVERVLADVTGEYYTLVMESRLDSLADFEEAVKRAGQHEEWQKAYRQLVPLVRAGRREVFREVA